MQAYMHKSKAGSGFIFICCFPDSLRLEEVSELNMCMYATIDPLYMFTVQSLCEHLWAKPFGNLHCGQKCFLQDYDRKLFKRNILSISPFQLLWGLYALIRCSFPHPSFWTSSCGSVVVLTLLPIMCLPPFKGYIHCAFDEYNVSANLSNTLFRGHLVLWGKERKVAHCS